jgi:hypothetical protein
MSLPEKRGNLAIKRECLNSERLRSVVILEIILPATITKRKHPFPFRTRKLSSLVPMVLLGRLSGRVGRCRVFLCPKKEKRRYTSFFRDVPFLKAVWPLNIYGALLTHAGVAAGGESSHPLLRIRFNTYSTIQCFVQPRATSLALSGYSEDPSSL